MEPIIPDPDQITSQNHKMGDGSSFPSPNSLTNDTAWTVTVESIGRAVEWLEGIAGNKHDGIIT